MKLLKELRVASEEGRDGWNFDTFEDVKDFMQCFLCVWRKSMASVHFSVLVIFCLGWTNKINIGQTKIPIFFLGGWVFFSINTLHVIQCGHPTKTRGKKRLTGRELLFLPFRRNKSLRSGQQNTLWLSVITALSGSLRWWTAQGMQQDWCEFGMRNIARCYVKCRREWPVALPSLPWEWGEKDGGFFGWRSCCFANNLMVSNECILWWVLKTHPFWGFEVDIFFLHKFWGMLRRGTWTSQTLNIAPSRESVGRSPGWGVKGRLVFLFNRHLFFSEPCPSIINRWIFRFWTGWVVSKRLRTFIS